MHNTPLKRPLWPGLEETNHTGHKTCHVEVSSCSHSATNPPKKLKCNKTPQKVFCTCSHSATNPTKKLKCNKTPQKVFCTCSHSATNPTKKLKCNKTPQKVFCTLTFLANLLLNLIMLSVGHFGLIMEMDQN